MNVFEEVDVYQDEDGDHIWLITKLAYYWRFREAENVVLKKKQSKCLASRMRS